MCIVCRVPTCQYQNYDLCTKQKTVRCMAPNLVVEPKLIGKRAFYFGVDGVHVEDDMVPESHCKLYTVCTGSLWVVTIYR